MKYDDEGPPGMIPLPFGCFCGDMYVSSYCMVIHLALLFPGLGIIPVLFLWLANKDRNRTVDRHGKAAVNWLLSFILYFVTSLVIALYYPPFKNALPAFAVAYYLFLIIAAAKAYNDQFWNYSLSIPFFGS